VSHVAYNVRYASAAFPAYLLLLSAGLLWWLRRPWVGTPVLAAVATVMVVSLVMNYDDAEYFRDDNRGAARVLQEKRSPGEPLIVGVEDRALAYYYPGEFESWEKLEILGAESQPEEGIPLEGPRLWVASTREWEDDDFSKMVNRLRLCFPIDQDIDLPGFEVLAFRIHESKGP